MYCLICRRCYADGTYTCSSMGDLTDLSVRYMVSDGFSEEQAHQSLKQPLPQPDCRKRHEELSGGGQSESFREQLIRNLCCIKK